MDTKRMFLMTLRKKALIGPFTLLYAYLALLVTTSLATLYLSLLMLCGQGEPEGDLPWYTEVVVSLTACFSIAFFAIPASMLSKYCPYS